MKRLFDQFRSQVAAYLTQWRTEPRQTLRRHLRLLLMAGLLIVLLAWLVWAFGAVAFFAFLGPFRLPVAALLPLLFLVALCRPKARRQAFVTGLAALAAATAVYLLIPASDRRDWEAEHARSPQVEFLSADRVRIADIRDFRYRSESDFEQRYRMEEYDLSTLESLDFIVVHWGGLESVGHTMLSFGFADGRHLAFSIEARREKGRSYHPVAGLYKQYEILCIIGTEEDLLGMRVNVRQEEVYLYPTVTEPEAARRIFTNLLQMAASWHERPRFYHTLFRNCTTALLPGIRAATGQELRNPLLLLNGFSDRLAYRTGWLRTFAFSESFADLKMRRCINPRGRFGVGGSEDYSRQIRELLVLPYELEKANELLQSTGMPPFSSVCEYDAAGEIVGVVYRYFGFSREAAQADFGRLLGPPERIGKSADTFSLSWRPERPRVAVELLETGEERYRVVVRARAE